MAKRKPKFLYITTAVPSRDKYRFVLVSAKVDQGMVCDTADLIGAISKAVTFWRGKLVHPTMLHSYEFNIRELENQRPYNKKFLAELKKWGVYELDATVHTIDNHCWELEDNLFDSTLLRI